MFCLLKFKGYCDIHLEGRCRSIQREEYFLNTGRRLFKIFLLLMHRHTKLHSITLTLSYVEVRVLFAVYILSKQIHYCILKNSECILKYFHDRNFQFTFRWAHTVVFKNFTEIYIIKTHFNGNLSKYCAVNWVKYSSKITHPFNHFDDASSRIFIRLCPTEFSSQFNFKHLSVCKSNYIFDISCEANDQSSLGL